LWARCKEWTGLAAGSGWGDVTPLEPPLPSVPRCYGDMPVGSDVGFLLEKNVVYSIPSSPSSCWVQLFCPLLSVCGEQGSHSEPGPDQPGYS
jgi:hypothetical protein